MTTRTAAAPKITPLAVALLALIGLPLTFGCTAELTPDLSEAEANEALVALDQAGIGATREPNRRAGVDRFKVIVARADLPAGMAVMHELGLPRESEPSFATLFDDPGLIPTATDERARQAAAVGGELGRSLENVQGVVRARVHIALPEREALALDEQAPAPRASVLITHRSGRDPAPGEASVQALVAGAVDGLEADHVTVVFAPSEPASARRPNLVWVGPIAVSRGTATPLKAALGGALLLNLLLAIGLILSRRRATATDVVSTTARDKNST